SQDPDEAFAKAKAAAEEMGLELRTTRDSLQEEMNEIKRATAEERERRERERAEREARWAAEREAEEEEKRELIRSGIFAIGAHRGKAFAEAPRGYITWLIETI